MEIPKSLAQCADKLYGLRAERLEAQREVDLMKKDENELRDHIIDNLPKSEATGVSGKLANAKVSNASEPVIQDRDKFQKYVVENDAWDLVPRSICRSAIKARWEDDVEVPGVGTITVVKLSLTKV